MPAFTATPAQLAIVTCFKPEWLHEGVFQGDDNDMAVVISNVARDLADLGLIETAVELETKVAPAGFSSATEDEFRIFFLNLAYFKATKAQVTRMAKIEGVKHLIDESKKRPEQYRAEFGILEGGEDGRPFFSPTDGTKLGLAQAKKIYENWVEDAR
jgi:hypothetical protein